MSNPEYIDQCPYSFLCFSDNSICGRDWGTQQVYRVVQSEKGKKEPDESVFNIFYFNKYFRASYFKVMSIYLVLFELGLCFKNYQT